MGSLNIIRLSNPLKLTRYTIIKKCSLTSVCVPTQMSDKPFLSLCRSFELAGFQNATSSSADNVVVHLIEAPFITGGDATICLEL